VLISAGGETAAFLQRHIEDLPMLFIVSDVELETAGPEGDLQIVVTRAEGEKCARCWRIVPSVSGRPDTEGLCDRCVAAVTAAAGEVAG
jgi:isoleucyl-tRNA synthetase